MVFFLIPLIVAAVFNVVAYIITPKPKQPKPEAVQQAEAPTASAGRPIGVLFGDGTISETNCLYFGEAAAREYEVEA
jgi:hypothetical protein